MEYQGAKRTFADLGRLVAVPCLPLKGISLLCNAAGWQEGAQAFDGAAHLAPYASLMTAYFISYNPAKERGIPDETFANRLTRGAILMGAGMFLPGLVDSLTAESLEVTPEPSADRFKGFGFGAPGGETDEPSTGIIPSIGRYMLYGLANTALFASLRAGINRIRGR